MAKQQREFEDSMRKREEEWRKERQEQQKQAQEDATKSLMTFQANLMKNCLGATRLITNK